MSEGIYALIGTIIGGCISFIGTYLTLRHSKKLEFEKLSLSFLMEKKTLIEGLINNCSSFEFTGNDIDDNELDIVGEYKVISKFMCRKSHYFIESEKFQELQKNIFDIDSDRYESPSGILYQQASLNTEALTFFESELESVMKYITKKLQPD